MTTQRPQPNSSDAESNSLSTRARSALTSTITSPTGRGVLIGLLVLIVASSPAAAQQLGEVYCGTAIENIIDTLFSAMLGLALPVSLAYTGFSGFRYMRAGGNPESERQAKQKLTYGVMGLLIVMLVLILPELADKLFSTVGAGFSDCVKPF